MSRYRNRQGRTLLAALALVIGLGVSAGPAGAATAAVPRTTTPVTVSGTAEEGQLLTGDRGQWSGSPVDYNYFWTRCDRNGGRCATISGAHASTYTLTSADVGNTLRFRVDARNADGKASDSSVPTALIASAAKAPPLNTSPVLATGTAQEGQRLTGDRGQWSGSPTDYNYFWTRCDKDGANCANIRSATAATYVLSAADVGNTVRFTVQAKNRDGSTFASSAQTAVIVSAIPPVATGCPTGAGPIQIAGLAPPARLLIDGQQASPAVIVGTTRQVTLRYHVSACAGRAVQGALLYVLVTPFNQVTVPAEAATGADGWGTLDLSMLAGGFPVSSRQQLLSIFVRARKADENLLGGISTRRLFSVRVVLNG